jgi:hypothetical protein
MGVRPVAGFLGSNPAPAAQCGGLAGRRAAASLAGWMDQLADEIEKLVRCMPGLTGMDLVRMLHERARSPHQIISICRRLVAEGRLERRGQGGWQRPFTYYPAGLRSAAGDEVTA